MDKKLKKEYIILGLINFVWSLFLLFLDYPFVLLIGVNCLFHLSFWMFLWFLQFEIEESFFTKKNSMYYHINVIAFLGYLWVPVILMIYFQLDDKNILPFTFFLTSTIIVVRHLKRKYF